MATTTAALFDALDQDRDGLLSRVDLGLGSAALGWGWPEAPLFALLDRLTLEGPLARETFELCLDQVIRLGPYGAVLTRAPGPRPTAPSGSERRAMLVIDPQRSFTRGAWMRSAGANARQEVAPIQRAFDNCAALLRRPPGGLEIMFTRCPFPPDSYGWEEGIAAVLPPDQPYFIKPGNNALFPPSNGYRRWLERLLEQGRDTLVLAGCTLNSCVRITALETAELMGAAGLKVVVDLDLCGARRSNHLPSPEFGGRSSVQAAVEQMEGAGVVVLQKN